MYSHLLLTFAASRASLRVAPRLDDEAEAELRRRLDDALTSGCRQLTVDCGHVTYIEASSLAALAEAKRHLEASGGSLVVGRRSATFIRSAQLCGFAELLDGTATPAGHDDPRHRGAPTTAGSTR